jgi:5'-nucleotidase
LGAFGKKPKTIKPFQQPLKDELSMKTRRNFLKGMALGTAALGAHPLFAASKDQVKITILHTNDLHSRIEPFNDRDPKYAGMGGLSRISALVNSIREHEQHVILLDSGDIFQGTPYFNRFGGELEFKLMSAIGYEAATLGNHDFDNGVDGLMEQLPHAEFDFINCNYGTSNSPLKERIIPYKIIHRGGVKIGITGIGIELEGLVLPKLYGNTQYHDPVEPANKIAQFLRKEEQCDLVICLSHLGYRYGDNGPISDVEFAKRSKDIHIILGGHTHTFLDEPIRVRNAAGKKVLINQVGWAGINLGRIDLMVNSWSGDLVYQATNLIVKSLV